MLYASLIASYNAAEKPFANPCEDRPTKILPQFIRAGRDAPVFFRRFLSPLGERGFSARKQPSPGTRFPPTRNRRPSMKTQPETTPTLCPLPPRAFRATDGEHRAENEEAPPRLPGLPRAEAEPQPEKFSEPDARLRLLRLLQKRRPAPHGPSSGVHAPRTGRPAGISGRRAGAHPLLRRRHPLAVRPGGRRGAAGPCRDAVRLRCGGGDHARSQSRRPHPRLPRRAAPRGRQPPVGRHPVVRRRVSQADEPPPQRCASRRGRAERTARRL